MRLLAAGFLALLSLLVVPGVSAAAPATPATPLASTPRAACAVSVENPHRTPRAGGIIAKARVSCVGDGTVDVVRVQLAGTLGSLPSSTAGGPAYGPPLPLAFSDLTQDVSVNGRPQTYYIPEEGKPLPQRAGFYEVSFAGRIVDPPGVRVDNWGHPVSKVQYVD